MEEEDFDDRPLILFLIFIAALTLFVIVLSISLKCREQIIHKPTEDIPIIKEDRSDGVLYENEMPCMYCGVDAAGMDGTIVCRNPECPLYGFAIIIYN